MPNIPRRKIYEKMLDYEDGFLEMQYLIVNPKKFKDLKFKIPKIFKKMEISYYEIKALFIIFLENKKFETENKFKEKLNELISKNNEVNKILFENKVLKDDFKNSIKKLDELFINFKEVNSIPQLKEKEKDLNEFNQIIPKILTIRRDKIQN